jgi:tetratricopeptide (TPR) repeat protein
MWERLNPTDAASLYNAACFRAVTAAILRATDESPEAVKNAAAEADLSMDWFGKAIAAGYSNVAHIKQDKDLDALRDREDFQKLVAGLEAQWSLNDRAWVLATDLDPTKRDPTRAVALAQEAVALSPQNGKFWNTLGVALYRADDYAAAIEALERSMKRRDGGDSCDSIFLAMAQWNLGNSDEARQWYDKASAWMEKNKPTEDLLRFRAEAAELLNIETKKD